MLSAKYGSEHLDTAPMVDVKVVSLRPRRLHKHGQESVDTMLAWHGGDAILHSHHSKGALIKFGSGDKVCGSGRH